MPNAASRSRKPNPVAMFWRRRLTRVLWTRNQPTATTAATNSTCTTTARTRGSRHGAGRVGRGARAAVSVANSFAPPPEAAASADRHRVDQATLGPEVVIAALELERRIDAQVLVEDLAVIADRLDRVVSPF